MSDSFADLWNTSAPSTAKPKPQTLTLAARLAEERKRHHATTTVDLQSHKAPDVSHAAWAGLDSLDSSGIKVKVDDDDDWGLRDFGSAAAAVNSDSNPTKSTSMSKTLWDLDDFTSSTGTTPPRSTTSFLDNDNEHDNLMGGSHEDEDILGVLSKPVEVVIAKKVSLFLITATSTLGEEMDLKKNFFLKNPFFRTRIQDPRRPSLILHHYLDKVQDPPPHPPTS